MKKYIFPISIGLTAIMLAAMAAYFSITGLGKIFLGWPILVMATAIELGKLMAVSVLYRLWDRLKWWKYLLVPMTVTIMLLTSAGIYGFLSASYEHTASGMRSSNSKIELEEKKKEGLNGRIKFYEESMDRKQQRANSLAGLRAQQENRMDSLYSKSQVRAAKGVQTMIAETDGEIGRLNKESDSLNVLIEQTQMKIAQADSLIISMNDEMGKGETGALKYLSRITGASMDSVANIFMVVIMFVFDPLAIILLIIFNIAWDKASEKRKEDEEEEQPEDQNKVEQPTETKKEVPYEEVALMPEEEVVHVEDVAEEKAAQPVQPLIYSTNESGEFVKIEDEQGGKEEVESAPTTVSKQELYLSLLRILYQDGGLKRHDHIDAYDRFTGSVIHSGIKCTVEQIDEFLKQCVIWKIIRIGNMERTVLKSYEDAIAEIKVRVTQ